MSTGHTPPSPPRASDPNEITIISHSNLFYWWPVWAVGFLMALLTYIDGHRMVTVPNHSQVAKTDTLTFAKANEGKETVKGRFAVILPENKGFSPEKDEELKNGPQDVRLHIARSKNYGVVFAIVLLLVIFVTNVPLRGMWSVLVIVGVITLALIFHLAGLWDAILRSLSVLDIRINMGGYLFLSIALLIVWGITMLLFDRQIYMIFTPGQLKVCTEIGGGEKVYDAIGMTVEKQRGDIFRHRILGLGSGDLIVKTAGAQAHHFDLPNVLFINKKVQMIEDMLKRRQVIESK